MERTYKTVETAKELLFSAMNALGLTVQQGFRFSVNDIKMELHIGNMGVPPLGGPDPRVSITFRKSIKPYETARFEGYPKDLDFDEIARQIQAALPIIKAYYDDLGKTNDLIPLLYEKYQTPDFWKNLGSFGLNASSPGYLSLNLRLGGAPEEIEKILKFIVETMSERP